MKKLTLLILGAASIGMVACNGVGSSSSGGDIPPGHLQNQVLLPRQQVLGLL